MLVSTFLLASTLLGGSGLGSDTGTPVRPGTAVPPPSTPTPLTPPDRPLDRIGPKLATRLRRAADDQILSFIAKGVSDEEVLAAGGHIRARIGPLVSGTGTKAAILALSRVARFVDAPKSYRPALDVSRRVIGADRTEDGDGFSMPYDGEGVLIAFYDTGIDVSHPDFRSASGGLRIRGILDQKSGAACIGSVRDCARDDAMGHGTSVASIAAGAGTEFRGIAPKAELVVAQSDDFEDLFGALAFFSEVATSAERPMVVNLALAGHEGAHDGTSLEAQAVEALPFITVTAAGNDGRRPVHAAVDLVDGPVNVPLALPRDVEHAVSYVEIWGEPTADLGVRVAVFREGALASATSSVGPSEMGRSEAVFVENDEVLTADIDAEPGLNPDNGKVHVRVEIALNLGMLTTHGLDTVIQIEGTGRADLWTDAPYPSPLTTFRSAAELGLPNEVAGDSDMSISDLATAPSAIAVSSFVTKADVSTPSEQASISSFSSFGPSADPARTGTKPDLSAPGEIIVAARSAAAEASRPVGSLYAGSRGTSLACAHVSGAAAVLLQIDPSLTKSQLEEVLSSSTQPSAAGEDPRSGAGALDVEQAARAIAGEASGCSCSEAGAGPATSAAGAYLGLILLLAGILPRRREVPRFRDVGRQTGGRDRS